MSDMEVAKTIIEQLGGLRNLVMMTGSKGFVADKNGVRFNVGKNTKGVSRVEIRLNAMDTYDIGFYAPKTYEVKAYLEGVYADQLMDIFERETGMYLTLAPRKS